MKHFYRVPCALFMLPGIIWEGENGYKSLMSGEPDLSSLPSHPPTTFGTLWPPAVCQDRCVSEEITQILIRVRSNRLHTLQLHISSGLFNQKKRFKGEMFPEITHKVQSGYSRRLLPQVLFMHVKQAHQAIWHQSYELEISLFMQSNTPHALYECWLSVAMTKMHFTL